MSKIRYLVSSVIPVFLIFVLLPDLQAYPAEQRDFCSPNHDYVVAVSSDKTARLMERSGKELDRWTLSILPYDGFVDNAGQNFVILHSYGLLIYQKGFGLRRSYGRDDLPLKKEDIGFFICAGWMRSCGDAHWYEAKHSGFLDDGKVFSVGLLNGDRLVVDLETCK